MTHKPLLVHSGNEMWVNCDCTGKDDCSHHDMCGMTIGYMRGKKPPNFPVPAILDDFSNPRVWECVLGYYEYFG